MPAKYLPDDQIFTLFFRRPVPFYANAQKISVGSTERPDHVFTPVGVYKGSIVSVSQVKKNLVIDFFDTSDVSKTTSEVVSLKEEVLVKKELFFTQAVLSQKTNKIWLFAKKKEHSAWLFGGIYNLETGEFSGWKEVMKRKNPSNSYNGAYTYNLNPKGSSMLITWEDSWKDITFDGVVMDETLQQTDVISFPLKEKRPDHYGDVLLDNDGNAYLVTRDRFSVYSLYRYQAAGKKFTNTTFNFKLHSVMDVRLSHNVNGVPFAIGFTKNSEVRGMCVLDLQSEDYMESVKHKEITATDVKPTVVPESFKLSEIVVGTQIRRVYPLAKGGFALHMEEFHQQVTPGTSAGTYVTKFIHEKLVEMHITEDAGITFVMAVPRSLFQYSSGYMGASSFLYNEHIVFSLHGRSFQL